ncbi:MAG: TolC family protein, partial [Proteobacteria bacterium]|nr:TolC family protein [Pseudomonadota bacterium]
MKKNSIMPVIGFSLACCWSTLAYGAESSPGVGSGEVIIGRTLEDFFTAAISYSPQLKIAEEELNISSARKRAAKGLLLPQLSANASRSDNKQQTPNQTLRFDGERYSLQLTQVLFNWEAFLARSQASLIEDQQEARYFAQLSWLLTDVAEKYFDALQADDAYESISSELDAISNQLNQIQSFYDLQLAQITDLYEAQARLAAVESEALELQSRRALSREALRSVTGVAVGRLYQLGETAAAPSVINNIEYWVEQARSSNQMILASRFALEAANKGVSAKRGAYMPQVSFI